VNRKFKLLGTFLIMALLVSLVSIVPLTAATAGTVTLEGGAENQSIRWYSATDDLAASQPVVDPNQILTIKVEDDDMNVLTSLPGTCGSTGLAYTFPCELLVNDDPGGAHLNVGYQTRHADLEDADQNDIPDSLFIRALQQGASGWFSPGTAASTGAVALTAPGLLAGVFQNMATANDLAGPIAAQPPTTPLTNFAQVQVVISDIAGVPTVGGNGIMVTGTSVDPTTMVATPLDTEILVAAGAVTAGTTVSAKFWSVITAWEVNHDATAADTFDINLDENYTVAARYQYNSVDEITDLVTVSSSAHALVVDVDLREAAVDADGDVTRDANGNLQDSAGSGVFAADVVITKNTADHDRSGGKVYEETKGAALPADIRGEQHAGGNTDAQHLADADGVSILEDSTAGFVADGIVVGDVVFNIDDGSSGVVTEVTDATHLKTVLTGGGLVGRLAGTGLNEWLNGDVYSVGDGRMRVFGDNGSLMTVAYKDADPAATITGTARVDLTPPVIELIGPADDSYSNVQGQAFRVKVTDTAVAENAAAGLDSTEINNITVNNVLSTNLSPLLVGTNSLQVSFSDTLTTEGVYEWWIAVRDQVGNFPVFVDDVATADVNEAVPGAGDPAEIAIAGGLAGAGVPGNPFTLTIDTAAPVYASAVTGGRLAGTDDVTAGPPAIAEDDLIADPTERKAVTVTYTLGTGDAPLNDASVAATDFRIAGVTPASVSVANTEGAAGAKTQHIVIEMTADQATNATPLVEIVGMLQDKAGNSAVLITGTDATDAMDKLAPVLAVTVTGQAASVPVSNDEVTVAVSSTESANLTGRVAFLKVAADGTLEEHAANFRTISFGSTGTNAWEATVDIGTATGGAGANTPGALNVQVTAQDDLSNIGTAGKDDPDGAAATGGVAGEWVDGALVFEFDNELNDSIAPTYANGSFILSPDISAAADPAEADVSNPFVRLDFNGEANEYPVTQAAPAVTVDVDTHSDMTLLSATLLRPGETVAEDVLAQMQQIDGNSFVFAGIDLALGDYTLSVTAQDEVGNVDTAGSTTAEEFEFEFTVSEKALFDLDLIPGMNLVSIPMDPVSTAIADVFGTVTDVDLVVTYDPVDAAGPWLIAQRNAETGLFEGTLASVDASHGYWVRAGSYTTAELDLPRMEYQMLAPVIPVVAGWNLVPIVNLAQLAQNAVVDEFSYLNNIDWNIAYTFDTMNNAWARIPRPAAVGANNLAVGHGYWVWVNEAGNIVP